MRRTILYPKERGWSDQLTKMLVSLWQGQKWLKSNTIIWFSHNVDGKSKLKMSLELNLDSISFQSHFLSLSLCFAAQETYIWKATPPFPRQHPHLTNRTYEDSCGFTHTFTASHTHTHFWNMWYIHSSNEFVLQFCSEDTSVELDFYWRRCECAKLASTILRCCYLVATICRMFF